MADKTELQYTAEHEWVLVDGDTALVGITAYAADKLGDVVFVELPAVGATLERGAVAGVAESVKAASDVISPAAGTVVAVNEALRADPSLANSQPLDGGWFYTLRLADGAALDHLLDSAAYAALLSST